MTTCVPHPAIDNVNIQTMLLLITPNELKAQYPLSKKAADTVLMGRQSIRAILDKSCHRLLVVVGPCSIHDPASALEYAKKLKVLADELKDTLYLVMRVYFEKPRTRVGWKGFINDPDMSDSFDIQKGLTTARHLLLNLNELGVPCATEALDPNTPQYLQDLISWSAIGARTAESQTHREMASGLSCPVGFKNGTDGNISVAINAMQAARLPHRFLGLSADGKVCVVQSTGNPHAHIVLRGGKTPNYDAQSVATVQTALKDAHLPINVMIDTSHGNSGKNPYIQPHVISDVITQIKNGDKGITGLMIESHLVGGRQDIPKDLAQLEYGKSVTDGCLDWEATAQLLRELATELKPILPKRI